MSCAPSGTLARAARVGAVRAVAVLLTWESVIFGGSRVLSTDFLVP